MSWPKLAPAAQPNGQPGGVDRRLQLFDALGEVRHIRDEVGAHMRRRYDGAGALRGGGPNEIQALADRRGTVVRPVEGVKVQL